MFTKDVKPLAFRGTPLKVYHRGKSWVWELVHYKIQKKCTYKVKMSYLLLCLRLSVPLFQEIDALGKAFGLHSIEMSPPT